MLTRRIIPCLDVRDGRVVKGVRFAGLRDAGDPVEQARSYEAQGADELVILDVSATSEGRAAAVDTVRRVREVISIPLTVGGGVRRIEDAVALLAAGADKVSINTAAVERPQLTAELAQRVGVQCVVLAIDAARTLTGAQGGERSQPTWEVVTHAGSRRTGIDVIEWAQRAQALGAGEVLLTSWDRDGTRAGYDVQLLRAVSSAVRIPVIASGGASSASDMVAAFEAGADAVLAASIFHDQETTVGQVKSSLAGAGVEVRS